MNTKASASLITLGIIAIFAVSGMVLLFSGSATGNAALQYSSVSPAPNTQFTCRESTGFDPAIAGHATLRDMSGGIITRSEDTCLMNGNLVEYYCTSKGISSSIVSCPGGCDNGACVG